MNYDDFDIFLITQDNWQKWPKDKKLLYGYKTVDDNGYWLEVFWDENDYLTIKGSYIQPYVSIYKDQNYWAISNNFYRLVEHLKEKGIKLTENPFFKNWNLEKGGEFSFCINANTIDTLYNEIKFNENFSYIQMIPQVGLTQNLIPVETFTKELKDSKSIILNWHKKYYDYIHSLKNEIISSELSGGFDSRIAHSFYADIPNVRIKSSWRKADTQDTKDYYDGLVARLFLVSHHNVAYEVISDKPKSSGNPDYKEKAKEKTINLNYLFTYGAYPQKKNIDLTNKEVEILTNKNEYVITGMSLELHKLILANSITEIVTTTRRFFVLKYLFNYYRYKKVTICPFQDREFLKIKGYKDLTFVYALLHILKLHDPEIPYYTVIDGKEIMLFLTDKEIEEKLKFLDE